MNRLSRASHLAWTLLFLVVESGCSGGRDLPETAAVVDGVEIRAADTEALVDAYLDRPQTGPPGEDLPRDETAKMVLEYQIKLTLLERFARDFGVSARPGSDIAAVADRIPPEAYGAIGERREDFIRGQQAERLRQAIAAKLYPDVPVPDEMVAEEYARLTPALGRNWIATAHIARFRSRGSAVEVGRRVEQGDPFEDAASALGAEGVVTVDINPLAAPVSGPVLDAIGALAVGEVSQAIASGGRWLAILVTDRQETRRLSLDDLRAEISMVVAERQRLSRFGDWFDERVAEADVSVDEHYGTWDPELAAVR